MARKVPWIGTSWKMNKLRADAALFANDLRASSVSKTVDVQPFVIPPFPYIADVAHILKDTRVMIASA